MAKGYWLVKTEPATFSWARFQKDRRATWDGVRNYQARNALRGMKRGDLALFYHSVEGKEIVGVARVTRTAYADPTAREGDWSAVDLVPVAPLTAPVSLAALRADPAFDGLLLLTRPRLSVMPISPAHFSRILKLAKTTL